MALITVLVPVDGASAADAATGIAAGLGLTAASGKTTVSSGGGAMEASLLASDAVLAAGEAIRHRADKQAVANGKAILVLGRTDAFDLGSSRWMFDRMHDLDNEVLAITADVCTKAPAKADQGAQDRVEALIGWPTPSFADVTAALATDVTINPITISEDDRMLMTAVASPRAQWRQLSDESALPTQVAPTHQFVIPGEIADAAASGPFYGRYRTLLQHADALTARGCVSDQAKGALSDVSDFVKAVGASSSKAQPPLVAAAELYTAAQLDPDTQPLVLRVAIEQIGGSAITKANIWYELGILQDPATVSAGVLASFRLVDPSNGKVLASGLVRCVSKPTSFDKVEKAVLTPNLSDNSCLVAEN
jgi:hypothetical protein